MEGTEPVKRRWFLVTPDRLVLGLLAVECLLWLSNWLDWPHWRKGYAVLTSIAVVGVFLLLMLLWLIIALVFRLRFQFSIRLLLVLVVAVALPFSWLGVEMKKAREQKQAVAMIVAVGGTVQYDYQITKGPFSNILNPKALPPGPGWLRVLIGGEYFQRVVMVDLRDTATTDDDLAILVKSLPDLEEIELIQTKISSDGLVHLAGLRKLKGLSLWNTSVDDEGLANLRNLTGLRSLVLDQTKVTDAGIVYLQELTNLEEWLGLAETQITDGGLKYFKNFTKLKEINLLRTKVTEQGVRDLRKSLPKTRISYSRDGGDAVSEPE